MSANLSRTDALRPLSWLIGFILIALIGAIEVHSPNWLLVVLCVMASLIVAIYAIAYLYFAVKDPDALRSEKYTLNKMAIQHGLLGDSQSGIIEVEQMRSTVKTIDQVPAIKSGAGSDAGE